MIVNLQHEMIGADRIVCYVVVKPNTPTTVSETKRCTPYASTMHHDPSLAHPPLFRAQRRWPSTGAPCQNCFIWEKCLDGINASKHFYDSW